MRSIFFQKSIPKVIATLALKKLWSGAVYAPTAPLQYRELPEPPLPGPHGVRVKNRMCGICASDLHLAFVNIDPSVHPAALPGADRLFLGHEVISEVVEIGEAVTSVAVGDRVTMTSRFIGAHCHSLDITPVCPSCARGNYAVCENLALGMGGGVGGGWSDSYTCHESELFRVEGLSDEQAMMMEPLACGVRAALRRPPAAGARVLVLGCGTIGLGTIQALRAAQPEATVYALARYPQQQSLAKAYGATLLEGDPLEATAALFDRPLLKGEFGNRTFLGGFDQIYDCVGNASSLNQSLRLLRADGDLILVGISINRLKVDLTPIWHQEISLVGAVAHGTEEWEGETLSTFALTQRWLQEGKLISEGMITHRFPLTQWKQAIRTAVDKGSGSIKVAFDWTEPAS